MIPGEGAAEVGVWMGPGRHLVSYPLRGGLRNLVAVEERAEWAADGWTREDDPDHLRRAFAGFGGPVPGWLDAVRTVHLWGLFRRPVARRWQDGRTALLGDAAHPMLPFLAQGANMALEDAWVLAERIGAAPVARALAEYEAARRQRVARVAAAAQANARNYHLRGLPRVVGHGVLRVADRVAPGVMVSRYRWLYEHDVTGRRLPLTAGR